MLGARMVEVSNAGRVVFPEIGATKGDVVAYYEALAGRILPHVAGRPLSIRRFPKGLAGPGFFQKNVPAHYPSSIARCEVPRRAGAVTVYPVIGEPEHLAYLANQGAIELHVPTSRAGEEAPDRLVVDLDPPAGALDRVRRAAALVRDALGELGLESALVATGSKGYHVVAPIAPAVTGFAIEEAAQKLATLLAAAHPDELTVSYRIANRGDRVFIDWLRNHPMASAVAPYSLRARPRASVAAPLAWDELERAAPGDLTIADRARLLERPDPLERLASRPGDGASFVAKVSERFERSGLVLEPFDRFRS